VIIECPNCRAKYQYDEERFERKPSKKIKCAKCQQIFEIHNPAFAAPEKPKVEADSTSIGKTSPKVAQLDVTEQSPLPGSSDDPRSTARHAPAVLGLPPGRRLSLAVLDGPDAGSVFRIEKPRVTIGRSGADLNLNDTEASRQHAALEIRDMNFTVSDLGSTNGTLVGGEKITEAVEIADKGEFVVGATTLMLIVTEDA
jgi:predicted Zn finger-like uncharacterized protein